LQKFFSMNNRKTVAKGMPQSPSILHTLYRISRLD